MTMDYRVGSVLLVICVSHLMISQARQTAGFDWVPGNSSLIGLIWSHDNQVFAASCLADNHSCGDGLNYFNHSTLIQDMEIDYIDNSLFLSDSNGEVSLLDLTTAGITPLSFLPKNVSEMSYDWLNRILYLVVDNQIVKCARDDNSQYRDCLIVIPSRNLTFGVHSVTADSYNGYLFWMDEVSSLYRYDFTPGSDSYRDPILVNISTYSITPNDHGLYFIQGSSISLSHLDGKNAQPHSLLASEGLHYSQLNCFDGEHCVWLENTDNHLSIPYWYKVSKRQYTPLTHLNVRPHSVIRQWHHDVQPYPDAIASVNISSVAVDATEVKIDWTKPDILERLRSSWRIANLWADGIYDKHNNRFMQSASAWSDWTYRVNVSTADNSWSTEYSGIKTNHYTIESLNPNTSYLFRIASYHDLDESLQKVTEATTLPFPLTMIYYYDKQISVTKALGRVDNSSLTVDLNIQSDVCDIRVINETMLYLLAIEQTDLSCANSFAFKVVYTLDLEQGRTTIIEGLKSVSAFTYDCIGEILYTGHLTGPTIRKSSQLGLWKPFLELKGSFVTGIEVDSRHGNIYWISYSKLYTCKLGSTDVCEATMLSLKTLYNTLLGPVIDYSTSQLYWSEISLTQSVLYSLELMSNGVSEIPRQTFKVKSSTSLRVVDHIMLSSNQTHLNQVELASPPGRVSAVLNHRVGAFTVLHNGSCPFVQGVSNSDIGKLRISPDSLVSRGTLESYVITWSLSHPVPSDVPVFFDVKVTDTSGVALYHKINQTSTNATMVGVPAYTRLNASVLAFNAWFSFVVAQATFVTPEAAPSPPRNVGLYTHLYLNSTDLFIAWDQPESPNGVITYFTIWVNDSLKLQEFNVTQPGDTVTVFNLGDLEDTDVKAKVLACNSAGCGNWSETVILRIQSLITFRHGPVFPSLTLTPYTPKQAYIRIHHNYTQTDGFSYTMLIYKQASPPERHSLSDITRSDLITSDEPAALVSSQLKVCGFEVASSSAFYQQTCVFSRNYSITTFPEPSPLTLVSVLTDEILVRWQSPTTNEIKSHRLYYRKQGDNNPLTKDRVAQRTIPNNIYMMKLDNLEPYTAYEVYLQVVYRQHMAKYQISVDGVVRTLPLPLKEVKVLASECDQKSCEFKVEWKGYYSRVLLQIFCPEGFNLTYNVTSNELKVPISAFRDVPYTACSHTAQAFDSSHQPGPVSAKATFRSKASSTPDPRRPSTDKVTTILIVVLIVFIIFLIAVVTAVYFRRKRSKLKKKQQSNGENQNGMPMTQLGLAIQTQYVVTDNESYETTNHLLPGDESIEAARKALPSFTHSQVRVGDLLGSGAFGEVFRATLLAEGDNCYRAVAVKSLRSTDPLSTKEFVKEARLMAEFHSDYIVSLVGVCLEVEPFYMLIELMDKGDLLNFLRSSRPNKEREGLLSLQQLTIICRDIAAGCSYLENLHFVHRDLAARNCLVMSDPKSEAAFRVKIADFGLARDIYRNDYYRKEGEALLPVRWMSPEALIDGLFTTPSDVWAYGVVMWEVFTLAVQPYPARSNIEVLQYVTAQGGKPERPTKCPQTLYDGIMDPCWTYEASGRPTFSVILEKLNKFLNDSISPDLLRAYTDQNKRLNSEIEFFAKSTSSTGGVLEDIHVDVSDPEHDVFDTESCVQSYTFHENRNPPASKKKKSLRDFFTRPRPSHRLLERGLSLPEGGYTLGMSSDQGNSTRRNTNRYVRSDSLKSADRFKARCYEDGGLKVELPSNSNVDTDTLKSQPELTVDLEVHAKKETPSAGTTSPPIQYSSISFDDRNKGAKQQPDPEAVQYSTVVFPQHSITEAKHSHHENNTPLSSGEVQSSTIAFN